MQRYTQKALKELVKNGIAIDATHFQHRTDIPHAYRQIGYAAGIYGCNGMLLQDEITGQLYAICDRTSAIYVF